MILQEVKEIYRNSDKEKLGERLNDLIDEFRGNRDRKEVLNLLNTNETDYIYTALLILNEITIRNKKLLHSVILYLENLVDHPEANIRMLNLIVLSDLLKNIDKEKEQDLFLKMMQDPDKDIRETALQLLETGKLV